MELQQGGALLPGPPSPGLGEEGPGSGDTKSDKQEVSFHDPGGSNSEDADDLNTLVTMTKAEQLTTPGRRSRPRHWVQRGRAPRHPETQLAGITGPALEQTGIGAKEEERKRKKLRVSSRMMGKVQAWPPFGPQGASGQPCQAAGQQTCASLHCEALKLWHLCWALCQVPGRAPRTTFSKSSVNTKGGRSRRQKRKGRNKEAPRGTSLK